MRALCRFAALAMALVACHAASAADGESGVVSGELKKWHKVTITFDGPETTEAATPNPFRDYRLTVTFTRGQRSYVVPGYYAADGNAAETSATEGSKWRVHFVPDEEGTWRYVASFRTGRDVALSLDPAAGRPTAFDGVRGTLDVGPTDKTGGDLRAKGMLRYVGKHHLQFAETGDYYLKAGADSPENLLGYADFDGTYDTGGLVADFLHRFDPHVRDWSAGDPTWQGGKGKGLIGALNYLASQGVNSVYFLTYNVDGGDGADTWPWTSHQERWRFDCSKLDQWEIVFSHMDRLGIQLHVVATEAENWRKLGGTRDLNPVRKLYYRELIARFAHHHAVIWNLGEENGNSDAERKAFAGYIRSLDPYDHPITVHTYSGKADTFYNGLLGDPNFEATSIQGPGSRYNHWATSLRERSRQAGRPWAICGDEQGPRVDQDLKNLAQLRKEALWGNLMGGGAGVEWYCGYQGAVSDMRMEDFRILEPLWEQTSQAVRFFQDHLAFHEMEPCNELVTGASDVLVLAKPGAAYAVYLPDGGEAKLNLGQMTIPFTVHWFDPRAGGQLETGDVKRISGPGPVPLGRPPHEPDRDWAALVRIEGEAEAHELTVNGGHGGGHYPAGALVPITADPPPAGHVFDQWTGDVEGLAEPAARRTTVTVRAGATSVIATYREGARQHAVVKFSLIDAQADRPIAAFDPLRDGAVVNLAKLPTRNLNVVAHTVPTTTGSVRFCLDDNDAYRVENAGPYALAGDRNGDYSDWTPSIGRHTLTATPYSESGGRGEAGKALTVAFEVIDRAE